MKYAGSIPLRRASLLEQTFVRQGKRKSFFRRMIEALHLSRRRQAQSLVRHYRHLLADPGSQAAGTFPDFINERESSQNANGDQAAVRTNHRTRQNA